MRGVVNEVVKCAQLAMLLEVSSYPKPGNVHRLSDHPDTKFEHYLASAVAVMPHMFKAANKAAEVARGVIEPRQAGVGRIIRGAVQDSLKAHRGGNTCLGVLLLLTPLTMAACYAKLKGDSMLEGLRGRIPIFTANTTPKDAAAIYEAIRAAKPGGIGRVSYLDVMDEDSIREIYRLKLTVNDVFKLSMGRDSVAREWVTNFEVTFNVGFPAFKRAYLASGDFNKSTVQAFLEILSAEPDSTVLRKAGRGEALRISRRASEILMAGGALTEEGLAQLYALDRELKEGGSKLNPGSTADITASTLMVALLNGFKP